MNKLLIKCYVWYLSRAATWDHICIVVCTMQNEDILKKCVADYQSKMKKMDEKFQVLKTQAEEKLNELVHFLV